MKQQMLDRQNKKNLQLNTTSPNYYFNGSMVDDYTDGSSVPANTAYLNL